MVLCKVYFIVHKLSESKEKVCILRIARSETGLGSGRRER